MVSNWSLAGNLLKSPIIIIIIIIRVFHISVSWRFFYRGFSDKFPQVSGTLLSILAVLNNVVVWMVSTRPPTSKSSSPFSNPLVGDISILDGTSVKLVDKFIYLGSSVSSTEKDIDTRLTKAWTATDRLSIIWKSNLTDKMKHSFFQAAVVSILLYGCTTWTLTKRLEKKLDGNYRRMLRTILNKSWQQHPTRCQLYGHLPPITKTIQARRTRHAGHCWRRRDEVISDVLLWTPTYDWEKAGWPARTFIQQLCDDTGCIPEDLPEAMNDMETWRERVRDIRASCMTWWWWWWWWSLFQTHPL